MKTLTLIKMLYYLQYYHNEILILLYWYVLYCYELLSLFNILLIYLFYLYIILLNTSIHMEDFMFQHISYYTPQNITTELSQTEFFKDFIFIGAGIFIHATNHKVTNRCIDEYVIIYCTDGKGWLDLDGKHYEIHTGDLFICPPNLIHSYGADKIIPWTNYWLHFKGPKSLLFMEYLGINASHPIMSIGINQNVIQRLEHMFEVLKMGYTTVNLLASTADTQNILSELNLIQANGPFSDQPNTTMESVIEFMLKHTCDNKTLDDFADYAHSSKSHFIRIFKEKTGYTPIDYYNRLRIQKACELLHSQTLSISEISNCLGFRDQFHFSKLFKKVIGYSPTFYRNIQL